MTGGRIEIEFPGRFLDLTGGRIRIACWPREAQELRDELLRVLNEVEEKASSSDRLDAQPDDPPMRGWGGAAPAGKLNADYRKAHGLPPVTR